MENMGCEGALILKKITSSMLVQKEKENSNFIPKCAQIWFCEILRVILCVYLYFSKEMYIKMPPLQKNDGSEFFGLKNKDIQLF